MIFRTFSQCDCFKCSTQVPPSSKRKFSCMRPRNLSKNTWTHGITRTYWRAITSKQVECKQRSRWTSAIRVNPNQVYGTLGFLLDFNICRWLFYCDFALTISLEGMLRCCSTTSLFFAMNLVTKAKQAIKSTWVATSQEPDIRRGKERTGEMKWDEWFKKKIMVLR